MVGRWIGPSGGGALSGPELRALITSPGGLLMTCATPNNPPHFIRPQDLPLSFLLKPKSAKENSIYVHNSVKLAHLAQFCAFVSVQVSSLRAFFNFLLSELKLLNKYQGRDVERLSGKVLMCELCSIDPLELQGGYRALASWAELNIISWPLGSAYSGYVWE